ncbi:MAG: class I SAM-dependent methyltransferase [Candidatus Bathyarchaeia archaeon]
MSTAHKKIIQRYYSKRAHDYDRQKIRTWKSKLGFEAKILNEVVNAVSQVKDRLILEVGVGSGRVALPLTKEIASQSIGVDLSKEMLKIAQMKMSAYKQKFSPLIGDAEHLPFRNNIFDAIICISTLHYFLFPKTSLEEFSRALKKRDIFLYGDVTMHESDHDNFLDKLEKTISHAHGKYSRPSEMKKLIEGCGIQVDKMEVVPYKKSYTALAEDKAQYFNVKPQILYEKINEASENERKLYSLEKKRMTLFYTLIKGAKQNQT